MAAPKLNAPSRPMTRNNAMRPSRDPNKKKENIVNKLRLFATFVVLAMLLSLALPARPRPQDPARSRPS